MITYSVIYLWLIPLCVVFFYGALLVVLVVTRRWSSPLALRFLLYLGMACLSNLVLVASYGNWAFPYISDTFLRTHVYAQSALPIFFYATVHASIGVRQRQWIFIPGIILLSALIAIDLTQASLNLAAGFTTTLTLVLILRAVLWVAYNGAVVAAGVQEYYRTASPLHHNRLAYLALASFFLFADGALDMIWGEAARPLALACQVVGMLVLSYATLRHSLIDLRMLLRRTISFGTLAVFTILVYLLVIEGALSVLGGAEQWQRWAGALIAAAILTFVYQPVRDLAQRGIELALFGRGYNVQWVVKNFSQKLSARIDLEELAQEGRTLLQQAMGARTAVLLVVNRDNAGYTLRAILAAPDVPPEIHLDKSSSLANVLAIRERPLSQYDIDRLPRYADISEDVRAALQRLRGEVYVPVLSRGELIGVWVIGARTSGDRYTDADLALLSTLADQSAVALENARLLADLREQMVQMRAMRDYLDSTMASIAAGVLTLDREGKIISLNRAAEVIFRVQVAEALGRSYEAVLPPLEGAQLPLLLARIWDQRAQHLVRDAVTQVPGRGQVHMTLHLSAMRRGNEMVGVAMVIEDLTEQVRLEMERRAQEQETQRVRDTFERYVAPTVVQGLLADSRRVELGGERQLVTVLFADLHGFTNLSEHLMPEELVHVLNGYLSLAYQVVLRYEGTLDKFLGDGVMAIFNAPLLQPDHAWRAACTSLTLQREITAFAMQLPESQRLAIRIGVHTGEAIVGNIGARELMNYTAIGDTVNIAKRLQENAAGGHILISSSTYTLIQQKVVVQPSETLSVKGREAPVEVFELTGAWELVGG